MQASIPLPHILQIKCRLFRLPRLVFIASTSANVSLYFCSGVTVVSRRASQFVHARPASLRIMLAAYCPNNPSGAGGNAALCRSYFSPLPHAASGAYPAQHWPDGREERRKHDMFSYLYFTLYIEHLQHKLYNI